MSTDRLDGKTELVTGAAKRIGRGIALALADAGVNVVVHYRESVAEADELHTELATRGVKSWLLKADFDAAETSGRLISDAVAAAGSLDILVNSASLFLPGTIKDIDVLVTSDLVLPDPQIAHRPFLAVPLSELAPDLKLPGTPSKMAELAAKLPSDKLRPLTAYTRRLRTDIKGTFHTTCDKA